MDKHQMLSRLIQEAMESPVTSRAEVATLALLNEIWDELKEICARTGAEALEDAEPDPFQTLNGPRIGYCVSPIIGGYADPLDLNGPVVTKEWIPDPPYTGWDK